ncbi:serine/threonine-protein kinase Nek4 isoform X2 [Spea bombifrons]|uniref:serine/threonine-protein kinase Nek4 isoform X2 n=1 Tax=Spea bombifrons TaxID=233779 RepID=UPI00234BE30F|nr:serine/threonine-protein kinase Nek4 isoform X2 [Spea bombifrons]
MEELGVAGNRLLDYSLIRPVGKGSYGEVSLVRHRVEGRQFVIKKLSLQNAPRRERRAAQQEAQLLSRLRHPNIVAYRESWEGDDGFLYIVMGYCEGGDLYHRLKEQKGQLLPEGRVVDWFVQIAMAMQYLHDERIMHRDLKTQNIFLTRSDIIKVGDLGIARVLESQYDMASTLIGTPYYMSPELFSNKPYNYKSDVWALGCCVYEMATLRHAFNAKDMNSLVYRIIEGKLPPMPKEYSSDLGELMATMLSRQPEKRPTVRQILRKPFIKRHISLFLQATKLNHGKRRKKVLESCASKADETPATKPKATQNKMKSRPLSRHPSVSEGCMSSISTLSKVDIDIPSPEKKSPSSGHSIRDGEPGNGRTAEVEHSVRLLAGGKKPTEPVPIGSMEGGGDTAGLLQPEPSGDGQFNPDGSESTEKLLEPFLPVPEQDGLSNKAEGAEFSMSPALQPHTSESGPSLSRQRRHRDREQDNFNQFDGMCQRPLPSPPAAIPKTVKIPRDSTDSSGNPSKSQEKSLDCRPLSARERRRLKQSQEEIFPCEPSVIRPPVGTESCANTSLEVAEEAASRRLSEDELSSSASSTEKSEGDCKDGKSDSNEMQDLVQLMTQTLHMEKEPKPPIPPNEFKLHRKYRDTLILHGKSPGDPEDLCFHDIPLDHLSAPEKFRRMIEALRADVVQGLGVKLLEDVYDIMEEEDELKREVCLQTQMGDKYAAYSQKVRQLKFFEENSKF